MQRQKVVIVGAGFAGLNAVRALAKNDDLDILIIDRRNYHLFQPLLYQVATAGLSPADIATPIRSIVSDEKHVKVMLANVDSVDLAAKTVSTDKEKIPFDYLVMACGAKHSYFGHPEWEDFSPGLKTLEQATEIRRRVLLAFEEAEKETDKEKQKQLLTFVIVGGGPTGVEMAGAIAEISRFTLEKDFRNIDPSRTRVLLIEAGSRVLASFDEKLSKRATRDLEKLGVQIWTSTRVTEVTAEGVRLGEETIRARTTIWAAGVQPSSLGKTLGVELDRSGRVVVEKDLSLKNHPHVFVLGDQACFQVDNGKTLPGLASVAIQQGRHAAKNITALSKGKPVREFKYLDKGQMATIGRKKAVAQVKAFKFAGFPAWIVWLFIHIYYLIGFKNRFFVFYQWAWSYVTFKRGARLITAKDWHSYSDSKVSKNEHIDS